MQKRVLLNAGSRSNESQRLNNDCRRGSSVRVPTASVSQIDDDEFSAGLDYIDQMLLDNAVNS